MCCACAHYHTYTYVTVVDLVRTCLFHRLARRRRCYVARHTYATVCEPGDHSCVPGDRSRMKRCTYATAREYIYRAHAHPFTCSELSTASSTRAVADLLCLDTLVVEPSVASSQQSVERGSTLGRSGRVVATRRPVSGGAWCVPESSRTSGLSAGSGDLRDRRSTADMCLVLLRGVGSPGARVSSGLCEIVGWQWRKIERRWTFSCPV